VTASCGPNGRASAAAALNDLVGGAAIDFPAAAGVWQALRTPGKLLGPDGGVIWGLLPLAICAGVEAPPEAACNLAAATDCLMAALDIIDDVQDGDAADALWRAWGVPTATNIATLLLFLSQQALCRLGDCQIDASTVRALVEMFACHGARACAGQQRDLDAVGRRATGEEDYLAMIGMKAGALVSCICRAAATLGSRDPTQIDTFAEAGFNLGMTLQILNDVAGITETADKRNDLQVWKWTLPLIFAFDAVGPSIRCELETVLGSCGDAPLPDIQVGRVRQILERCGALHYARLVADIYWDRMRTGLDQVSGEQAQPMIDLVTSLYPEV